MKQTTIGSVIFVVHKDYANQNKIGGLVEKARVCSFRNVAGKVVPEFKLSGQKSTMNAKNYVVFQEIEDAIKSIETN